MLYLANPASAGAVAAMRAGLIGLLDTPAQGSATRIAEAHDGGALWAADNGAFSDRWDPESWWAWLTDDLQLRNLDRCLFATAPDVVGDAAATFERSMPWLPRIRALGYPVAYVAQNGVDVLPYDEFDVLFLGGSLECRSCAYVWPKGVRAQRRQPCPTCRRTMTEWKLGPVARDVTVDALARGRRVHMGRVNSAKRYDYARSIGCSSVDGTFLVHGADRRLPELLGWIRSPDHPTLV